MTHHLAALLLFSFLFTAPALASDKMSVAFSGAEIRSAPSAMSSKVLFTAAKYCPLTVSGTEAEYYRVSDHAGRTGYIHKSLMKKTPTVVVTGDGCYVRTGPGKKNSIAFQVAKGTTARLLESTNGWVQVETARGEQGWIADFLVWGE